MKISIKVTHPEKSPKACLMVGIFENGKLLNSAKQLDSYFEGRLSQLVKQAAFDGKIGQNLVFFLQHKQHLQQILLVGCGPAASMTPFNFRKAIFDAVKILNTANITEVICYLAEIEVNHQPLSWKIRQIIEATYDAVYRFDLFKSKKEPAVTIKEFIVHIAHKKDEKISEAALKQGIAVSNGVTLAKNLANLPSNVCTPSFLAEQAKDLAKSHASMSVDILEEKDMQKLGMGALLAVSQGSALDAKLICLQYKGTGKKEAPIALVGKGITFDTGGNSLKPADAMVGMKYDMCGAASVLGTLKAIAELKLPLNVVGLVPTAENMPGGTAYKAEDIITSMSGLTIEVITTDAEGRLILCDALTYCERYKPKAVIDIATLTGAVVVALGYHATAILSNDEPLAKALLKAGVESNDRGWQLPLWEEYQEQIKSPFADIANVGGRSAGTITAACFLSRFAKKFHWAHLDVAGTAAMMMGTNERMATGRPVPMLVQYLIDQTNAE